MAPKKIGIMMTNELFLLSAKKTATQMQAAGLINEVLSGDGDALLLSVLDKVQTGFELGGAPSIRGRSLKTFKGLMRPEHAQKELRLHNYKEQALVAQRRANGDQAINAKYYAAQMPGRKT
jgi:hypothetical protein